MSPSEMTEAEGAFGSQAPSCDFAPGPDPLSRVPCRVCGHYWVQGEEGMADREAAYVATRVDQCLRD